MQKTATLFCIALLGLSVAIVSYTGISTNTNTTERFSLIIKALEQQNSFNRTQLITNEAILKKIDSLESKLKLTDHLANEQHDLIKQMTRFDFDTVKLLCDRIAALEKKANE